jgi:glucose-1-phosphate adenylyltransferase
MPAIDEAMAVILGGGRGTRLYPLTKMRSKPAVPIAGKYRLIDIPISNCINSGIIRIAVLTQFNSVSLHRHIARTYNFDAFHLGWVQVWAAEQTMQNADWYQGTADAVRKQLFEIKSAHSKYVFVLAGDHLYRMDYEAMAKFHWETKADITVAVQPVNKGDAGRFGILKRDKDMQITNVAEKPKTTEILEGLVSRDDPEKPYLGSMGIYLFNIDALVDVLESTTFEDFGGQVIPHAIGNSAVYGYDFDGYWEDIGTIRSYYETNLALTAPEPQFNFFDAERPIYTHARPLPGSTIENSILKDVLLAEGSCIKNAEISRSVVGLRSQIRSGVRMVDTILIGSDYYDQPHQDDCSEYITIGIGSGCQIEGAIIDKNARIGKDVTICPFPRGTDLDGDNWVVRDGIVVIPKDATLYHGTYIGPDLLR